MTDRKSASVPWRKVAAFRLRRHHLSERAPASALSSVAGDIAGAQAQVLQAAQVSFSSRTRARDKDLESAVWKDRSLVRAWAMRRTMFLLPSNQLAVFARGTARRSGYAYRWISSRMGSEQSLEKLFTGILEILTEPRTRTDLAETLKRSHGYKLRSKAGGGWGSKRNVPWLDIGKTSVPIGYLLHAMESKHPICSGPSIGVESTYVRSERWLKDWKDIPVETAERLLLRKYLGAFGPATIGDFALWAGFYMRDAKPIWAAEEKNMVTVDVEGWKASILQSDLSDLESADLDETVVRLLPYFDSYLLGHKSHLNIVDEKNRKKVYRNQGWVSPVVLVDGRAEGVWGYEQKKNDLEVRVSPFSKLSSGVLSKLEEEATELGRFFEASNVKTAIAK